MSKTVEELVRIFKHARDVSHDERYAMASVVRALRDELFPPAGFPLMTEEEHVWSKINEILGVAESEKASGSEPASVHTQEQRPDHQVAGSANTVDAQQCQTTTIPAAAYPAPAERSDATAVCVWGKQDHGFEHTTSCGLLTRYKPLPSSHCHICGKPIRFVEVKQS